MHILSNLCNYIVFVVYYIYKYKYKYKYIIILLNNNPIKLYRLFKERK